MKLKNLKLMFAAVAGFAVCSTLGGNVHAAEINKNSLGHTNYKDELVYNGRVYEGGDFSEDFVFNFGGTTGSWFNNLKFKQKVEVSENEYDSSLHRLSHFVFKLVDSKKVILDKWFVNYVDYKKLALNVQNIVNTDAQKKGLSDTDYEIRGVNHDKYDRNRRPHSVDFVDVLSWITKENNLIGWRKIGKTWFFVYNGKITKTKTNAKVPYDKVMYGYYLNGSRESYMNDMRSNYAITYRFAMKNKIAIGGDGRHLLKTYSRSMDTIFATLRGSKQYLLVDQKSGKVVYNKWHECLQWDYKKDRKGKWYIVSKKFYMKSDKHGHVAKGTYKGLHYKWTFGNNGILKRQQKI